MDTNNLQVVLPSTSKSAAPAYTFKRPYLQCFSLPYPIIKYMIQNPRSGKVWKKLIMSCKYFYFKYPVLPVKSLEICDLEFKADGEVFDSSKPFSKLWVYDYFSVVKSSGISTLITKIFKFDLCVLHLYRQSLTIHDYQKLTSSGSVTMLYLFYCEIKNADGTIVTADKLFENLEHLNMVHMVRPNPIMFQPVAVKKMVHHFDKYNNMCSFELWEMEETFDFSSFVDFLMKNEFVYINFSFLDVSDAYKEMVKNVVKEIKKNPSLFVPRINFF